MKNIIFKTNIESADWISTDNCWNLVTSGGKKFSCNVLFGCTGYFSYENPNEPTFPGIFKRISISYVLHSLEISGSFSNFNTSEKLFKSHIFGIKKIYVVLSVYFYFFHFVQFYFFQ